MERAIALAKRASDELKVMDEPDPEDQRPPTRPIAALLFKAEDIQDAHRNLYLAHRISGYTEKPRKSHSHLRE